MDLMKQLILYSSNFAQTYLNAPPKKGWTLLRLKRIWCRRPISDSNRLEKCPGLGIAGRFIAIKGIGVLIFPSAYR